VIEDTLILVGGCNYSDISPGVCFVNLNTLAVYEFNVPVSLSFLKYMLISLNL
jgi:hypothetical protein